MSTFPPKRWHDRGWETKQKSPSTPRRQVDWCIESETVSYTCSECAWKFVVKVGEYSEPMRVFIKHNCADYPREGERTTENLI
jgi:hypothetical protein